MRKLSLFALAAVAATMSPSAATPGGVVVTAAFTYAPGSQQNPLGVSTGPLRIQQGTDLVYVNADPASVAFGAHSVTHTGCLPGSGEACLFDSGSQEFGDAVVVETSDLPRGSYPFVCSVHPPDMQGTLIVE